MQKSTIKPKLSRLKVRQWTKNGWGHPVTTVPVEKKVAPNYDAKEYESTEYGVYAQLREINNKIQAGCPANEIDNLPQFTRMLYEENGPFFLGDSGVYRKVDKIEQAIDYQEYGLYIEDADDYQQRMENIDTLINDAANEKYFQQMDEAIEEENDILSVYTEEEFRGNVESEYTFQVLNDTADVNEYRGPKEKVETVERKYYNSNTISANEREERFKELFDEISFCKTKKQIFGVPVQQEDGSIEWSGGFLEKIRDFYNQDKELIKKWSHESKMKARRDFIKEFRAKRKESGSVKYNEEKLRKALYMKFDAATSKKFMELSEENMEADSQWEKDKTKAYNELYLTKSQWATIYKMKDIIVSRIDMDYKRDTNRDKVMEELRKGWVEIKTQEELMDYISNALNRKWINKKTVKVGTFIDDNNKERIKYMGINTCDFKPSLIDQISIKDEFNWRRGLHQKAKQLGLGLTKEKVTTTVRRMITNLDISKNYKQDIKKIENLINKYKLDISI